MSSDEDEKCDEATDHETVHLPNTEAEDSRRVARVKHKEHVVHWSAKTKNTPWSAEHLRLLEKAFMHFKKPPDSKSIKELLTKEPGLQNRTVPQIKSRAWALISSKIASAK